MSTRGWRAAAVALAVAAALLVVSRMAGEGWPDARPPDPRATAGPGEYAPEVPRWHRQLAGRLVVLRRGATAADRLPPALLRSRLLEGVSVDARSARRASSVHPAWIVRTADRQICVVSWSALSCARVRKLLSDGAAPGVSWRAGDGVTVSGIAADDVASVVVRYRRNAVTIPVVDNYFAVRAWQIPTSIEWRGFRGKARMLLPASLSSQRVARVAAPGMTAQPPDDR